MAESKEKVDIEWEKAMQEELERKQKLVEEFKVKTVRSSLYLNKIGKYFSDRPGIGGSLIYIVISSIGVVYSWSLYREFKLNIFDYAETNDFLLIAFKEPYVLLICLVLMFVCYRIYIDISKKTEKRFEEMESILKKDQKYYNPEYLKYVRHFVKRKRFLIELYFRILYPIVLYCICIPGILYLSSKGTAHLIRGKKPTVNVLYESGQQGLALVVEKLESCLIGSTDKFMFFYDHSNKNAIVIPLSKIISITTYKEQRKGDVEKEGGSAKL
jgi:hypothetical protein